MVTPGGRPERRESGKRVPDRFVFGYMIKFLRTGMISFKI